MNKLGFLAVGAFALLLLAVYWFSDPMPEPVVVTLQAGPSPPRVPPSEAGMDSAAIQNAVAYAADRNTRALVVARNGHVVFEKYWGDTTFETPVELSGFTPVLAALSVGSAMNDRLIPGIDQSMSNFVPGFADTPSGKKTLRELLAKDDPEMDGAWGVNLVVEAVERVTKQSYDTVVAERLWKLLEAGSFTMERRSAEGPGAVRGSCCMTARLGDWVRVGELIGRHGVYEGNELIPPEFAAQMLKPTSKDSKHGFFIHAGGEFAAHDLVWLESDGRQRLWIVPSLALVILRVGDEPSNEKGWDEAMIPDTIVRAVAVQDVKAGEGADPKLFAPH